MRVEANGFATLDVDRFADDGERFQHAAEDRELPGVVEPFSIKVFDIRGDVGSTPTR
jgi:hypothetical protein